MKSSMVAQISAAIYYQANVFDKLMTSKELHKNFKTIVYRQIQKDFGEYIDAQGRTKKKSFHHVYEWNRVGQKEARLFKLNATDVDGFSFKIGYEFMTSKTAVPNSNNKRRHVFRNKAAMMELGMPLKIAPRHSERLVFEYNGETVFMPKGASVTVRRPGGAAVRNQFDLAYSRFFRSNLVNLSIKRSGFQKIFNNSVVKAMRLPTSIKKISYTFSPNIVRSQADAAVRAAVGMVI